MGAIANSLLDSPANREIAIQGPFHFLADETILKIFSFLPPEALVRASAVCKKWHGLAEEDELWKNFDLKKVFPALQIIDRTVWSRCVDLPAFELSFDDGGNCKTSDQKR